jgi:hypothetical protein
LGTLIRRAAPPVLAGALVLALAAPSAFATESRTEYAAQVNPICASANAQINQVYAELEAKAKRLEKKQKKRGKRSGSSVVFFEASASKSKKAKKHDGSLDAFDRLFYEAYERSEIIYAAALAQIGQVAPAPGDESLVSRWLSTNHLIQDLNEQATELSKRIDRLFNREFTGRTIRSFRKFEQRTKRLERKSKRIYAQLEIAYDLDLELGTELGATYCVTGATGA